MVNDLPEATQIRGGKAWAWIAIYSLPKLVLIASSKKDMSVFIYTGFPHYLKVEQACENFHKLKWGKAKSTYFL